MSFRYRSIDSHRPSVPCAQRCNSLTLAQDITEQNGVSAVPTVIVFHKGKRTEHMFMGNQPPAQLAEFIEKVSKL